MTKITLGRDNAYPEKYDPRLLQGIPRALGREECGLYDDSLPFTGLDYWTAYELSWLNPKGKPCVAVCEFVFSADSPNLIESKSFKYYLNSLNQMVFADKLELMECVQNDLAKVSGADVICRIYAVDEYIDLGVLNGECLDHLDIRVEDYRPNSGLLSVDESKSVQKVAFYSHLLKTNCPVTGQPDWASVFIQYSGKQIHRESLLQYLVSFRGHQGFHEQCIEKIFLDIKQYCFTDELTVLGRYTRRGGLDINPVRTDCDELEGEVRTGRQ